MSIQPLMHHCPIPVQLQLHVRLQSHDKYIDNNDTADANTNKGEILKAKFKPPTHTETIYKQLYGWQGVTLSPCANHYLAFPHISVDGRGCSLQHS